MKVQQSDNSLPSRLQPTERFWRGSGELVGGQHNITNLQTKLR